MERAPHDELKVSWLAGNLDVAFRMTTNQALHGERMASWRVQGALLFFVLHKTLGTTQKTEIGLASNEKVLYYLLWSVAPTRNSKGTWPEGTQRMLKESKLSGPSAQHCPRACGNHT